MLYFNMTDKNVIGHSQIAGNELTRQMIDQNNFREEQINKLVEMLVLRTQQFTIISDLNIIGTFDGKTSD